LGKLFNSTDKDINLDNDDFEELKRRSYSQFGWPKVNIECDDSSFSYIIKKGLMHLSSYVPKIVYEPVSIHAHQSEYVLDKYEQVNGVLDVYASTEYLIGLGLPIQATLGVPMSLASANETAHLTNFVSLMSSYQMSKNIWQVQPMAELLHPNIVRLLPTPYCDSIFVLAITINHENNLESLTKWEKDWLVRWCQAGVGKFVGQVRRKYDGVTLPVGTLSTSGASIYTENDELEKGLMEELKKFKKYNQMFVARG